MKHPLFATTAAASIDHEARAQAACLSDEVRAGQGLGSQQAEDNRQYVDMEAFLPLEPVV